MFYDSLTKSPFIGLLTSPKFKKMTFRKSALLPSSRKETPTW